MSQCEACGVFGRSKEGFAHVRTTNGGLNLCEQCLSDINRKNPELIRLREVLGNILETAEEGNPDKAFEMLRTEVLT